MDMTGQNRNNLIIYSGCGLISRSIKTSGVMRTGITLLCIAVILVVFSLIIFSLV